MNDSVFIKIFGYRCISSSLTGITYAILVFETALMWGWTALLIWADRKPLERRGVVLLTLPVLGIMLVFNIVGIVSGISYISLTVLIIQFLIIVLFIVSYVFATKLAKNITANTGTLDQKLSGV